MYCSGGHGLSIGSGTSQPALSLSLSSPTNITAVGGKSGGTPSNTVTNIHFSNSSLTDSTNGPRIKTNYNTTAVISNITYTNIALSDISTYGIDLQQDYLNGGPTGTPTNGVLISNVIFQNVKGTALESATNYYVLCGDGSCTNIEFIDVEITGGGETSSCNYPPEGCPT
jgi:polygalacturonase